MQGIANGWKELLSVKTIQHVQIQLTIKTNSIIQAVMVIAMCRPSTQDTVTLELISAADKESESLHFVASTNSWTPLTYITSPTNQRDQRVHLTSYTNMIGQKVI